MTMSSSTNNQLCQTDSAPFDFERAQGFRMKGRFCDLVIQSTANDNKKFIKCHRVILATVSPFFEDKLGKGTVNSLSIPHIEHETLEILIDYMYCSGGLISFNIENVFKICSGANRLKLEELVTSCMQFIRSLVTLKDVIQVFKFSLTDNFHTLSKTCITFIVDNLKKVKPFGFLDLDYNQVGMLVEHGIQSQTIAMSDILEAVSEWLHSNLEERQKYASSLISKIPLAKIGLKNLRKLIREDDCLKNIPEIYASYVDALEEIGLRLEHAQMEKRKAEELESDKKEETVVTDYDHLSKSGTSKRGRFSNEDEGTSIETTSPRSNSSDRDIPIDIDTVINDIKATLSNIWSKKKALVYFISAELVGSRFQNSIVSYDLETKHIEMLVPIAGLHNNSSLVYHKQKIYSLGDMKFRNGAQRNPVSVFSLLTKQWEQNAPDHVEARAGFRTVVLDDYLYTVGGSNPAGESRDVERLKMQTPYDKWENVAKMPLSSCSFGICVANGRIYVLGGNTYVLSRLPTVHSNVMCYTPERNKWVNKQHMPKPRRGFAVAVVGRYIYVLGGSKSTTGNIDHVSSIDIYDTELDTWKQGISMNHRRQFFSAIVYNNYIYALGGDSGDHATVERFSLERQVWEDMGSLPEFGRYHNVVLHLEEL